MMMSNSSKKTDGSKTLGARLQPMILSNSSKKTDGSKTE